VTGSLYSTEILRLAASTGSFERLVAPDAAAERRSPVCGSRVLIELDLDKSGNIAKVGGEVRACALGQASTALLGRHAIGRSSTDVQTVRNALAEYLTGTGTLETGWPGLDVFDKARAHPARHAAILLPFDAALAAFAEVQQ
jgi:NifU-like protein involved in Fe-S cluster formation